MEILKKGQNYGTSLEDVMSIGVKEGYWCTSQPRAEKKHFIFWE